MFVANEKMISVIHSTKVKINDEITVALAEIVSDGFCRRNNCNLLKFFYKKNNRVNLSNFFDECEYECFINSFHIDDYIENHDLNQSFSFVGNILSMWESKKFNSLLNIILSVDNKNVLFKAYTERENISYLCEDINSYDEAILITNSVYDYLSGINNIKCKS